jgi:hypothetical protein
MDQVQDSTGSEARFCPECGSDQDGYFCRNCGELLRGEDMVLCPRCHQVVPAGEYCCQCGQLLRGIALQLRQLAQVGDAFWITSDVAEADHSAETGLPRLEEPVRLAAADLPDWVYELSADSVRRDDEARIYPALKPIDAWPQSSSQRGRFLAAVILLAGLLLLSLVLLTFVVLIRGG